MPFPVTMEVLERGQERYNIYCTPCHSRVGNGAGMIVAARLPAGGELPYAAADGCAAGTLFQRDDATATARCRTTRRRFRRRTAGPSWRTSRRCN